MRYRFILASNSPRRRALFARIMPRRLFKAVASGIKEKRLPGETPRRFVMRMAEQKARAVMGRCGEMARGCKAVIGADTVVVVGRRILQQPRNRKDARRMLRFLSDRKHAVMTSVCFLLPKAGRRERIFVKSEVWFKKLSERTIRDYVSTGEAMDKAGAYAIQGRGRDLISRYCGSFTNIVGLPVRETRELLEHIRGSGLNI
jgi:septum formation protein